MRAMPRQKRSDEAGVVYHALNRGNDRKTIFKKPEDYDAFIRILDEGLLKYPVELFSFCLMPNHWHLVLRPKKDDRSTAGAVVPNRHRRFSHRGRSHALVIGSSESMRHSLKKNCWRCERPSIAVAPLVTRHGLTRSQNGTDCGTQCARSDAPERSRRNSSEPKIESVAPVTFSSSPFDCPCWPCLPSRRSR